MNDVLTLADKAAQSNDRYLLVLALILLVLFVVAIWRWMTTDREKIAKRLTDVTDRHIQVTEHLIEVVATNTHALNNSTSAIAQVHEVIRKCKGD